MTIEEVMEYACDHQPLYRPLIMSLKPKSTEEDTATMATDGEHIFYNPKFLAKLTMQQAAGVVLHETLHCAHRHLWRRDARDMYKFNVAADYAINPIVVENFPLPKGVLLDMKYAHMSAEEIYDVLPPIKKIKIGIGSGSGKGKSKGDSSSGYENKQQKWGDHSMWNGKKSKKGKQSLADKIMGKNKGEDEAEMTAKQRRLHEKWKDLFEKHIVKQYGKLPDSLKRIVEKEYYIPVLDWTALVSSLLSEDQNDYSFSQPDRRFLEADYILPDLYSIDRLKDVVFAYDTSGSVTQDMLKQFYMETLNLFNNFSSLQGYIAVCDWTLKHFSPVDAQDSFTDFNFIGGGGTSFEPVFDEIKRKGIRPKAVFYFTDTYGSFPNEDPGYPVFWLVPTEIGEFGERHVPFGLVIPFAPKM